MILSLGEHDGRAASLNGRDHIVEDARVPGSVGCEDDHGYQTVDPTRPPAHPRLHVPKAS